MARRGKIIIQGPPDVILYDGFRDRYEMRTIYDLRSYTKTAIEVIPVENIRGTKTPDIKMNGFLWEIKNPRGKGKYVISRNLYTASKQSANIVLDIRRLPGSYRHYLSEITREFEHNPQAKRLLVVTKAQTILEFTK